MGNNEHSPDHSKETDSPKKELVDLRREDRQREQLKDRDDRACRFSSCNK